MHKPALVVDQGVGGSDLAPGATRLAHEREPVVTERFEDLELLLFEMHLILTERALDWIL
jgi:hypothetical protein